MRQGFDSLHPYQHLLQMPLKRYTAEQFEFKFKDPRRTKPESPLFGITLRNGIIVPLRVFRYEPHHVFTVSILDNGAAPEKVQAALPAKAARAIKMYQATFLSGDPGYCHFAVLLKGTNHLGFNSEFLCVPIRFQLDQSITHDIRDVDWEDQRNRHYISM